MGRRTIDSGDGTREMTELDSGWYRVYEYVPNGNDLGDLHYVGLGLYNPTRDGTLAEQVITWMKQGAAFQKKDFFLKPGTYFMIPEAFTQGGTEHSFTVHEQAIDYGNS